MADILPLPRTLWRVSRALVLVGLVFCAASAHAQPQPPAEGFAPRQAPMAEVPAGVFLMGSSGKDRHALAREKPQRSIELSGFWMDVYEVSNARYERCVAAKACQPARLRGVKRAGYYSNDKAPLQPVVGVTLADATAYCTWAGRRLPTEAEWEKAARGAEGRIYPWGDEPPTCELGNFKVCGKVALELQPRPKGASPYGIQDLAGNVIEWTSTPYLSDYLSTAAAKDPADPKRPAKTWRVIRGGSWGSYPGQLRAAMRRAWDPFFAGHTVGFRCASSAAPEPAARWAPPAR